MWITAFLTLWPVHAQTYEYPIYPRSRDLSQTLTVKIMLRCARPEDISNLDMAKVLTYIKQLDCITRGMPKVIVLGGYQQDGHDHQYPWWTPINDSFVAPGNRTGKSALLWLVNEARKYNTSCTFHVNPFDAYDDSPKWDEYVSKDLICKNLNGSLVKGDIWWNRQSYMVNLAKEWDEGTGQRRIDEFIAEMPIVKETGVLYYDNITQYPSSSFHGITADNQRDAIKKHATYLKNKYGVQLIGEYADPKLYGFLALGVTWDWNSSLQVNQMEIPAYLMCGGRDIAHDNVCGTPTNLKPHLQVFGSSLQLEDIQFQYNPDRVVREFTHHTLAYFNLNRLMRMNYRQAGGGLTLNLSDGYVSKFENNIHTLHRDGHLVKEGYDVFLPVYWVNHLEIMAYSYKGATRNWSFPNDWQGVESVDVYTFNSDHNGLVRIDQDRPVINQSIEMQMEANKAYILVPSGTDMADKSTIYTNPATGTVAFIGENRTTYGNWKGTVGALGYDLFGVKSKIPEGVSVNYSGDILEVTEGLSENGSLLQHPETEQGRVASQRHSELHQLIDVSVDGSVEKAISLYFADYKNQQSQILVDVIDADTKQVLHSRIIKDLSKGVYLSYSVGGHIQFRLTRFFNDYYKATGKPFCNALFFDDPGALNISGVTHSAKMGCYPNPFKVSTRIPVPFSADGKATLRVSDFQGKTLVVKEYDVEKDFSEIIFTPLDHGNLVRGVYLYTVRTRDEEVRGSMIYE